MMKIGIDIRNIGKKRTGDEVVFFNLVKNLAQIDNGNEYFLFTDIQDQELLKNIRQDLGIENNPSFRIVSLESGNKFLWNAWTLPKYLRQNPIDIYHTQYILPFFIPKKIKLITTIHDISFNFYPQFIKFTDLFFLKILIPWSLRRADRIVAISEFTKNEIINFYGIREEKIVCILNAVADNFFGRDFSSDELEKVRNKYSLPQRFFLYMGTMQPRKNLPIIIEALARIKPKIGNLKFVITGNKKSHNFDKNIDAAIRINSMDEEVVFPGYVDEADKPALFRLAEFFCFPSFYEGFGIPVLEAIIMGVPVLASDIPSLREVAGEAALFADPSSLDDMADKLYTISTNNDTKKALISTGKSRTDIFSWRKSAEKMLNLYNQL